MPSGDRTPSADSGGPTGSIHEAELPVWARLIVVVATVQVAAALAMYLSAGESSSRPTPVAMWVYAVVSATFTALGAALAFGSRRDARAAWLGAVLVLTGTPFATPLIQTSHPPAFAWLAYVRTEAFGAACLWSLRETGWWAAGGEAN